MSEESYLWTLPTSPLTKACTPFPPCYTSSLARPKNQLSSVPKLSIFHTFFVLYLRFCPWAPCFLCCEKKRNLICLNLLPCLWNVRHISSIFLYFSHAYQLRPSRVLCWYKTSRSYRFDVRFTFPFMHEDVQEEDQIFSSLRFPWLLPVEVSPRLLLHRTDTRRTQESRTPGKVTEARDGTRTFWGKQEKAIQTRPLNIITAFLYPSIRWTTSR